jgi:multiple sugar transport system substrate-binding protein
VAFANTVRNLPTTLAALASPDLEQTPELAVFSDILRHPGSGYPPLLPEGSSYFDPINAFLERWQAGDVPDLTAGLAQLDEEIAAVLGRG